MKDGAIYWEDGRENQSFCVGHMKFQKPNRFSSEESVCYLKLREEDGTRDINLRVDSVDAILSCGYG